MTSSLTILDVGHGNSAVVQGSEGVVVIDAGPGGGDLLRYLSEEEITQVDCIVISHADNDHLRGLLALLEDPSVEIGEIRLNPDAAKMTDLWDDVAWSLDKLHNEGKVHVLTACGNGDKLPAVDEGVDIEALGPTKQLVLHGPGWQDSAGRTATSNTCSVVVRLSVDGTHVALLPGDIDSMGLDYLSGSHDGMDAHILVFPHHGGNVGRTSNTQANKDFSDRLLQMVQPKSVVFSIGRGSHSTPRPEIVLAVRSFGADVRIACTQLSQYCRQDDPSPEAQSHLLDIHARGRETRSCCAGSLRWHFGDEFDPSLESHEAFKLAEAPSALCSADVEG